MKFRPDISHIVSFIGGAFLMMALFFVDGQIGKIEYVTERSLQTATSVQLVPARQASTSHVAEEDAKNEGEVSELSEVSGESVIELTEDELAVVEPDIFEDESETADQAAQVASALASSAEETLQELTQQQTAAEEDDEPLYFTLPSGIRVDVQGNIINEDGTVEVINEPDAKTVNPSVPLPPGIFQTPSGQYVDINGTIINNIETLIAQHEAQQKTQQQNLGGYITLPSGVVIDSSGNVISTPEDNTDTSTKPTVGSTLDIKSSTVLALRLNNGNVTCQNLGLPAPEHAVCILYESNFDDYTWVEVDG